MRLRNENRDIKIKEKQVGSKYDEQMLYAANIVDVVYVYRNGCSIRL